MTTDPGSLDFRAIFESSPVLTMVLDHGLRIAAVTDAYASALRARREELVGRHVFDLYPDDPRSPTVVPFSAASLLRVLTSRADDAVDVRSVEPAPDHATHREERHWHLSSSPVLAADGSIAWILHRAIDVTSRSPTSPVARREGEEPAAPWRTPVEAMRVTGPALLTLVRRAPISVALFDRGMVCLAASDRWTRAFGRGRASVEGLCHYDVHPDLPAWWREVHQRGLAGEASSSEEELWVQSDGTKVWLRWAVTPWVDGRGLVAGVLIATEDLTAWKNAEAALAESRARYEAIVASAMDAIVSVDAGRRIVAFNGAAERMFRCAAADAVGSPIDRFVPERFRAAHAGYVERFGRDGVTRRAMRDLGTLTGLRADGEEFPVDASVARAEVAGAPLFTAILRDVTERRQLERDVLEVCSVEQRRIGVDLHDDVCQWLAGTMLLAAALARDLTDAGAPEGARAQAVADNLRQTLDRARTLARGLAPAVIDSAGFGGALRELAARSAALFGLRCTYEGPDALAGVDDVAALHLYRLTQEAIHNASRHGGAQSIEVALRADGDRATLSVGDDGSGMPADSPGGGMGLRTMRYRVGVIGGRLTIEPREGGGTIVTCTFPLAGGARAGG